LRKSFAVVAVLLCAGCAGSYTTPGGPVHLEDVSGGSDSIPRQPSPHFPANIAVVRVQAPQYRSYSSDSYGKGGFSIVSNHELLSEAELQALAKWPAVETVSALNPQLLPIALDSLDDLRLAAAKHQADILLIYTVDTSFRVQDKDYGPQSSIPLGSKPDADSYVASTATAVFTDVRTGYVYGEAKASAKLADLGKAWASDKLIDQQRLEAEHQAFVQLSAEAEKAWAGIAQQYR
jgi:hypothetical protein